ncbi:hypothetical protein CCP3SC1_130025 [Gammaproteobacteria bacterium]
MRMYLQLTLRENAAMGRWLKTLLLVVCVVAPLEVHSTDASTAEVSPHGGDVPIAVRPPASSLESSTAAEMSATAKVSAVPGAPTPDEATTTTKVTPVVVKATEVINPAKTSSIVETLVPTEAPTTPQAVKTTEAPPPAKETSPAVKGAPASPKAAETVLSVPVKAPLPAAEMLPVVSKTVPKATEVVVPVPAPPEVSPVVTVTPKVVAPQTTTAIVKPALEGGDEAATLVAATLVRPSARSLVQVERAAASDPKALPRLAAMLLGRNNRGDVSRATLLLERFLRQRPMDARGSVQLLLLLAREREIRALARKGGYAWSCEAADLAQAKAEQATDIQDDELTILRKELVETREERDAARHEAVELRRKLKDLTSIEKSMDERKSH